MTFNQSIINGFVITYLCFWVAFVVEFVFIRFLSFASKIGEEMYSYRINFLKKYTLLKRAIVEHKTVKGAVLIALLLWGRSLLILLLGIVLLSPVLLLLSGVLTLSLLALWKNTRALVWTLAIVLFESAGYALVAGIGVAAGWNWLFQNVPFAEVIVQNAAAVMYGFLAVIVLQITAAFIEATAVIHLRIPGIPLDAIIVDEQ
ncbi:MAG: hypothetical protein AYK19_09685 [Theionarchaea archaeon DG-70-1]|nr:MAG: hypothetical protein AYK19_09685 [Theionarchaea archaeon DG-70-1]